MAVFVRPKGKGGWRSVATGLAKVVDQIAQCAMCEAIACGGLLLGKAADKDRPQKSEPWHFWRLEGPGFVWNYRVLPHVHCFVNIAKTA